MTADEIRVLLERYLGRGVDLSLSSYLMLAVISLVGAFLGAYLKKRGEEVATRETFKEILDRLRRTTQATEDIKASVSAEQRARIWEREDRIRFHDERRKLYAGFLGSTGRAIASFSESLWWSSFRDQASTDRSREEGHKNRADELARAESAVGEARAVYLEIMIVGTGPVLESASELLAQLNECTKPELQILDEAVTQPVIEKLGALRAKFLGRVRDELGVSSPQ